MVGKIGKNIQNGVCFLLKVSMSQGCLFRGFSGNDFWDFLLLLPGIQAIECERLGT